MVQQDKERADISLEGNKADYTAEDIVNITMPELINTFPHSTGKVFGLRKAPGCLYFVLDLKPLIIETADKDRIVNTLKFDTRNNTVVKTTYCFNLTDLFIDTTLKELGLAINKMIDNLKGSQEEESLTNLSHLKNLGFKTD
tara:strand:- start:492 stop:917 length:426 start_codon:yes stop_codon:yes gene_type:complete